MDNERAFCLCREVKVEIHLTPNFVLMFMVPDTLTPNKQFCNVDNYTLIRIIFGVSWKKSTLGKARYMPMQHGEWLLIY
jgi:hypothetical protein